MGGVESCCSPSSRVDAESSVRDPRCGLFNPFLVLHFNVSKTIVMSDVNRKKTTEQVIGEVLAASTWGHVEEEGWISSAAWTWDGTPPAPVSADATAVSYADFLRQQDMEQTDRDQKLSEFGKDGTEHPEVANVRRDLEAAMALPAGVPCKPYKDLFSPGSLPAEQPWQFIVPSFFRLLRKLADNKRHFVIVLRSFGADLDQGVVDELNAFAEGKHPFYPDVGPFDGSYGRPDLRLPLSEPSSHGSFYRDEKGDFLVMGTLERPPPDDGLSEVGIKHFKGRIEGGIKITSGHAAIHDLIMVTCSKRQAIAFRDYRPFWDARKESAESGKLLYIDTGDPMLHSIFFDDNIFPDEPHIVDARDTEGKPLGFEAVSGVHLVRCDPLACVLDPEYFVNCVERAEMKRQKRGMPS